MPSPDQPDRDCLSMILGDISYFTTLRQVIAAYQRVLLGIQCGHPPAKYESPVIRITRRFAGMLDDILRNNHWHREPRERIRLALNLAEQTSTLTNTLPANAVRIRHMRQTSEILD